MEKVQERETRSELVSRLIERDGLVCQYPGSEHPISLEDEGSKSVTIDHWYPQSWAFGQGWSYEQVWDLSNLKLMCKKHNASKGDLLPREDGTLPEKKTRTFKYRRDKRAQRADICTACNAGRELGPDEVCASCGSGPMPHRWPRWAKVPSHECLHDGIFWCWACGSGVVEMRPATETILLGGEGGDDYE